MDYEIRAPRPEEIVLLPDIERGASARFAPFGLEAVMSQVITPAAEHERARQEGRVWVAALRGGGPVGFALASLYGERAHLDELDVMEAHGRKGLGRKLVEAVERWARGQGARELTLSTMRDIPWNGPWYASLGFVYVAPDTYHAELRALVEKEAQHGLPMDGRVIMRKTLA